MARKLSARLINVKTYCYDFKRVPNVFDSFFNQLDMYHEYIIIIGVMSIYKINYNVITLYRVLVCMKRRRTYTLCIRKQ